MRCTICNHVQHDLLDVGDFHVSIQSFQDGSTEEEIGIVVGKFCNKEFEYRSFIWCNGEQSTIGYEWMPCQHWAITKRSSERIK